MVEQLEGVVVAAGALESGADALAHAADRKPIDTDQLRHSIGKRDFGSAGAE
jgi:hypothetical protein